MNCYFQGGDNPLSHRQKPCKRRMTALLACLWLGVLNSYNFLYTPRLNCYELSLLYSSSQNFSRIIPLTKHNTYDILKRLFALHINLQYKLSRPWQKPWSRVAEVTVESFIHGTVVTNTGLWIFSYIRKRKCTHTQIVQSILRGN